jgi:hypothetical protein
MGEEISEWQVDSIQTSIKPVSNYFLPSSNNGMSSLSYHLGDREKRIADNVLLDIVTRPWGKNLRLTYEQNSFYKQLHNGYQKMPN